jgi:hypothetical protein
LQEIHEHLPKAVGIAPDEGEIGWNPRETSILHLQREARRDSSTMDDGHARRAERFQCA